MTGVNMTEE